MGLRDLRVLRPARGGLCQAHHRVDRVRLQPLVPQALHQAQKDRQLLLLRECQSTLSAIDVCAALPHRYLLVPNIEYVR